MEVSVNFTFESVMPKTLVVKTMKYQQGAAEHDLSAVYGGKQENVWVATFVDNDEAQAFILGSNHFGQPVKGIVVANAASQAVPNPKGNDSGVVSAPAGESTGGSVRKAH